MSLKPFILDCSVAMSWCFEDEHDEYSEFILNHCTKFTAIVPKLWKLEVINALLIAEKRFRLSIADSTKAMDMLNSLSINISDLSFSIYEIINVARSNNLTPYDADYLMTAMHMGLAMATKNKALIRACEDNGVPLLDKNIFTKDYGNF